MKAKRNCSDYGNYRTLACPLREYDPREIKNCPDWTDVDPYDPDESDLD